MIEQRLFRIGLIVNPWAGIGGSVGLKGSDSAEIVHEALQRGGEPKAGERALATLQLLEPFAKAIQWVTVPGPMGGQIVEQAGHTPEWLPGEPANTQSTAQDTQRIASKLHRAGVDLLIFVGGDGTARDIYSALGQEQLVLGIPAGVKIHSGVYAVSPQGAAQVVAAMIQGELVNVDVCEVRDLDEDAFRQGRVIARHFGEMTVPAEARYMQQVKCGGREVEELVLPEIAAEVIEHMDDGTRYIMGSGSTVAAIMEQLGLENTLLGVDVIQDDEVLARDVNENELWEWVQDAPCQLVVTVIGGQGHLFGRGNQQISPRIIRKLGRDNIIVVASKSKLESLQGRPLIADTGDPELDRQLAGQITVITGYENRVLYRLGLEYPLSGATP